MRKRAGKALQDRVEPHLRAHLQPHRAVRFRFLAHPWCAPNSAEFVTRKARYEGDIERIIWGEWTCVHGVRDTPSPAKLHRADVHLVHFRGDDRAVALFNERTCNAAPPEFACKGEPDWPAPDN